MGKCYTVIVTLLSLFILCFVFRFIASFYKHVLLSPNAVLNMSVPAILYTFQTNLLYIAASHLDPATFIVLQQLKIFSSAISSLFLLNRRLSAGQWSALLLLFTGICIVQMARIDSGKSSNIQGDKFIGKSSQYFLFFFRLYRSSHSGRNFWICWSLHGTSTEVSRTSLYLDAEHSNGYSCHSCLLLHCPSSRWTESSGRFHQLCPRIRLHHLSCRGFCFSGRPIRRRLHQVR